MKYVSNIICPQEHMDKQFLFESNCHVFISYKDQKIQAYSKVAQDLT